MYDWRCKCGNENHPVVLNCMRCGKQHWAHLGIGRSAALLLLEKILPDYLLDQLVRA